jgi:hypothetical protein
MTNNDTLVFPELKFDARGELEILPSPSSSENDFDFLVGKSNIRNRRLKSRLNTCTEWIEIDATAEMHKVLNGIGNIDSFFSTFDGQPFEGITIRIFNPKTKLWSIYWADSNGAKMDPPVVGSFKNKIGHFFTKDRFKGKDIIIGFVWDARDKDNPVWSQAFSADNGKTWEWNWHMYVTKSYEL